METDLDKLSFLKEKLIKLQQELKKLTKMKENIYKDNCEMVIEQFSLEEQIKTLKENKATYKMKENEVKRKQIFTIIKTSVIFILLEYVSIALSLLIFGQFQIIFFLVANLITIPSSLKFGEDKNYYSDRKILKKHSIKEITENINDLEQKALLTSEKQDKVSEELSNLVISIRKIEEQMSSLIEQINDLEGAKSNSLENINESSKNDELEEPNNKQNSRKRKK